MAKRYAAGLVGSFSTWVATPNVLAFEGQREVKTCRFWLCWGRPWHCGLGGCSCCNRLFRNFLKFLWYIYVSALLIDGLLWQFTGEHGLKQIIKTLAVLRRFDERTQQHLAQLLTIQGRLQGKDAPEPVKFPDTDRNAGVL
jgi:hypothetical protein